MISPQQCLSSIMHSPYPSKSDKENAKLLMRHATNARRRNDYLGQRVHVLETKVAELKAAMAALEKDNE